MSGDPVTEHASRQDSRSRPRAHGAVPRGQDSHSIPPPGVSPGRFGYLFPDAVGNQVGEKEFNRRAGHLRLLGEAMIDAESGGERQPDLGDPDDDENPHIPAGYTYLGQFIDHDITFDPASSLEGQ